MPGGCDFGVRPIDQHIKGFEMLGAKVETIDGMVCANADKLVGASIYMDVVSVGATMNIMLAAVLARVLPLLKMPLRNRISLTLRFSLTQWAQT